MQNSKAIFGKVISKIQRDDRGFDITFEDGQKANLNEEPIDNIIFNMVLSENMLDELPVYVEVDDLRNITTVLQPKKFDVGDIILLDTGDYQLTFLQSAAIYHLRKNNSNFKNILIAIENSKSNNNPIYITSSLDTMEIYDKF